MAKVVYVNSAVMNHRLYMLRDCCADIIVACRHVHHYARDGRETGKSERTLGEWAIDVDVRAVDQGEWLHCCLKS